MLPLAQDGFRGARAPCCLGCRIAKIELALPGRNKVPLLALDPFLRFLQQSLGYRDPFLRLLQHLFRGREATLGFVAATLAAFGALDGGMQVRRRSTEILERGCQSCRDEQIEYVGWKPERCSEFGMLRGDI